jgi:hypothetical protein
MRIAVLILGSLLLTHLSGAETTIYRCTIADATVYSDRPCALNADPHEIDDSRVTVYTPAPVEKGVPPATPAKPEKARRIKAKRLPDPAKHAATCAKLELGLRDVRTKMRTGYGVAEGERLKERRRQLDDRRRTEKCG